MVKYSCERCGKEFSQKSHYDSHNRRKTPCENNVYKIKALVDNVVEEKLKELNNKKLIVENEEVIVNTDTIEHLPKQPKKFKIKNKDLTIVETFVGCGGAHLGFKQNGFKNEEPICNIDDQSVCVKSIRTKRFKWHLVHWCS